MDVVVDKEGRILVADCDNEKLRKIVGRQVTTLAGGSDAGTADGAGAGARFKKPYAMALDERGRLLVAELGREDTLRVGRVACAAGVDGPGGGPRCEGATRAGHQLSPLWPADGSHAAGHQVSRAV